MFEKFSIHYYHPVLFDNEHYPSELVYIGHDKERNLGKFLLKNDYDEKGLEARFILRYEYDEVFSCPEDAISNAIDKVKQHLDKLTKRLYAISKNNKV